MNREGGRAQTRRAPTAIAAAVIVAAALAGASPAAGTAQTALRAARAPASELELERKITLPGGSTVRRYSQVVGGIPVLGGEAVALDLAGAPASLVADASRSAIDAPPTPTLTRARAVAIALEATKVRRPAALPRATLGIQPGERGTLVWRVLAPSERPLGDFEVLVDARSGTVLSTRDRLWRSSGTARLFMTNPVTAQGSWSRLRRDRGDRNTKRLTQLRELVTLHRLPRRSGCLRGKYAKALLGRHERRVCKPSRHWNGVKRAGDRFEALMTYHWLDSTQDYIQDLGFSDATGNGANDRRQVAVADAILPPAFGQDNSFYSPGTRLIKYGAGGVDDAEDGDVIVHEYGHAVQDNQVPGFGSCGGFCPAGAMGEGFGDYLAATVSAELGGASDFFATCIFDWDGISYIDDEPFCGRTADTDDTKTDRQGPPCFAEIHCWGETWSSALWDLRDTLGDDPSGPPVIDRVLIASHFMLTRNPSFCEGAEALLAADNALYPDPPPGDGQGAHYDDIQAEMTERQFLPGTC